MEENSKGTLGMFAAPVAGLAGDIIGMFGQRKREERAMKNQEKLMGIQRENQAILNRQGAQLAKENWDYTNYENQRKHLESAGLNAGLLYGQSGGGGSTLASGSGGGASGGNAPAPQPMEIGSALQNAVTSANIELMRSQAEKNRAEAENLGAKTTTENTTRNLLTENMRQSGIGQWFANISKEYQMSKPNENENEITVYRNAVYDKGSGGVDNESPEAKKLNADILKTLAEKEQALSNADLTNQKALGYWNELMNATAHAKADMIKANSIKLANEWGTGEYTNWKTWADLSMKAVQTIGGAIKGGTKINNNTSSTYNQNGDRWNDK